MARTISGVELKGNFFPHQKHVFIDEIVFPDGKLQPGAETESRFAVPANFRIFASHFEDYPVVPGVMQAQMMQNTASAFLSAMDFTSHYLKKIQNARFRQPIGPNTALLISAVVTEISEDYCVFKASIKDEKSQKTCATAQLFFELSNEPELRSYPELPMTSTYIDQETVADFLPHGPDILLCDRIRQIKFSERVQEMQSSGRVHEVTFPDIVDTKVTSRYMAHRHHYLMDNNRRGQQILPFCFHPEVPAQSVVFMLWEGIKPDDVDMQTMLLSFTLIGHNQLPADTEVECAVRLVQARGNEKKGYMNFFEATLYNGDTVFSEISYNAICNYIPKT